MKKLLKFELYKVVSKKAIWYLLVFALALNIAALAWENKSDDGAASFAETKSFYNTLRNMNNAEKLKFLSERKDEINAVLLKEELELEKALDPQAANLKDKQEQYKTVYTKYKDVLDKKQDYNSARKELSLIKEYETEFETVSGYKSFLQNIKLNAEIQLNSSIFSKSGDDFSSRNIAKTAEAYNSMHNIDIRYDINKGIRLLFHSPVTDLILLTIIIGICFSLITDEKDKKLFYLIKSTPGGMLETIGAKLTALFICVAAANLLIMLSTAIFAGVSYGFGDLSRSIQSVPEMMGSTLKLSAAQFIVLFAAVKTLGLFIISTIIMFIAIEAKHPITLLLWTVLLTAASVMTAQISPQSVLNWLRYLNPVSLMNPSEILETYANLDFFSVPVNIVSAFAVYCFFLLILFLFLNCYFYVTKKGLENRRLPFSYINAHIEIFKQHTYKHFAFYEMKKVFSVNKAALILVLFVLFQCYSFSQAKQYFTSDEYYYKYYMNTLEGPLTKEKETYILAKKAEFDKAQSKIDEIMSEYKQGKISQEEMIIGQEPYQEKLEQSSAFTLVYEKYEYINENKSSQFLYDSGYKQLFGISDSNAGLKYGFMMTVVLILCLCGTFSIEYKSGMYKVLNAAKKGNRNTVTAKLGLSCIVGIMAFISAYLPELLFIGKYYGYRGTNIPLVSIPELKFFGTIPIWGYIVILYLLRLIVCLGLAMIIDAVSLMTKNNVYTAILSAAVLLTPVIAHNYNINIFDSVSIIPLLSVNVFFVKDFSALNIVTASIFIMLVICSLLFVYRRFGKANPIHFHTPKKSFCHSK